MINSNNNIEFNVDEMCAFFDTWTLLKPEERIEFEKILENENPYGFKLFKEDVLLVYGNDF